MSPESDFKHLIGCAKAGDQQAWAELIRRYGPSIRRAVHARLRDNRLRRLFDSSDVCQSAMGDFFQRVQSGEIEFQSPAELIGYLTKAARNKLVTHAKKQAAARRDHRRNLHGDAVMQELVDSAPSPSEMVSEKELSQAVLACMSEEDRYLWTQHANGRTWVELAAETGDEPDTLRMRIDRRCKRIKEQLGL